MQALLCVFVPSGGQWMSQAQMAKGLESLGVYNVQEEDTALLMRRYGSGEGMDGA